MHGKFIRKSKYLKQKEQDIYQNLAKRTIISQTFPSAFPPPPVQNVYSKPVNTINNIKYVPTREDILWSLGLSWTLTGRKAILNIERSLHITLTPTQIQLVDQYFRRYGTNTNSIRALGNIIRNKNLQIVNTLLNPQQTVESLEFFLSDYLTALMKGQLVFPKKYYTSMLSTPGNQANTISMINAKKEIYKKLGISPENKSLILFLINETGDYNKAKEFWSKYKTPENWKEAVGWINNQLQAALPSSIASILDLAGAPQNVTDIARGTTSALQYLIPTYGAVLLTTGITSLIINEGPSGAAKTLVNSAVSMLNLNYKNMTTSQITEKIAIQAMILCGAGLGTKKITGIIKSNGGLKAAFGDLINIIRNKYKISINEANEILNNILAQSRTAADQLKLDPREFILNASKDANEWINKTIQKNINQDPYHYQRGHWGEKKPSKERLPSPRANGRSIVPLKQITKDTVGAGDLPNIVNLPKDTAFQKIKDYVQKNQKQIKKNIGKYGLYTVIGGGGMLSLPNIINFIYSAVKKGAKCVGVNEALNYSNASTTNEKHTDNNAASLGPAKFKQKRIYYNNLLEKIFCYRQQNKKNDNIFYQISFPFDNKKIGETFAVFDFYIRKEKIYDDEFYNILKEGRVNVTSSTNLPSCDNILNNSKVKTDNSPNGYDPLELDSEMWKK